MVMDGGHVELRQLVYFSAVAEELNFARAAERLHIVQPAVSQQIRRLERDLGVQLFDRTSRRVRLTAAGERLLPEARAVLAAADQTRRLAAELASSGILRLGTSQGLGERLPQVLDELARTAPALRVELVGARADQRLAMLRSGQLDSAFVRAVPQARDLELLPLWDDPLVAALPATHPLAASATLELRQLSELPLRLAPRDDNPPFHDFVLAACTAAGFEPMLGPAFTNPQDTLAEIGTGPPCWTALYAGAAAQLTASRLAFRPLTGLAIQTYLAAPPGPPTPALRHLLDACATVS
jgi:DNA-binding transcriptional LysR family regulator